MRPLTEILIVIALCVLILIVWTNYATVSNFNANFLNAIEKTEKLNQIYSDNMRLLNNNLIGIKANIGSMIDHGLDVRAKFESPPPTEMPLTKLLTPTAPVPVPTSAPVPTPEKRSTHKPKPASDRQGQQRVYRTPRPESRANRPDQEDVRSKHAPHSDRRSRHHREQD